MGTTGGTLNPAAGTTLTYNGIVAGAAGMGPKTNPGTLVLGGANTYSGSTIVGAGTLEDRPPYPAQRPSPTHDSRSLKGPLATSPASSPNPPLDRLGAAGGPSNDRRRHTTYPAPAPA